MKDKKIVLLVVVSLVLISGCVNSITEYEASKVNVDNQTLNSTGYEHVDTKEVYYNETVNVSEQEVDISVLSYASVYEKQNDGELVPRSAYATLSTPSVSPGGIELNPTITNPTDTVIKEINKRNEDFKFKIEGKSENINISHKYNNETKIEKYDANIVVKEANATVDAHIYSGVVRSSDSVIVMAGMIPTAVSDQEGQEDKIIKMMKATKSK